MLKFTAFRSHIPADSVKLVGLKKTITSHNNVSVEFIVDCLLGNFFNNLTLLVTLLVIATVQLLFNKSKAVVDR